MGIGFEKRAESAKGSLRLNDKTDDLTEAKVSRKLESWSPVWIIPIVAVLIGAGSLSATFADGTGNHLITYNAEGSKPVKPKSKSRSVDVGVVESVMLDQSYMPRDHQGPPERRDERRSARKIPFLGGETDGRP